MDGDPFFASSGNNKKGKRKRSLHRPPASKGNETSNRRRKQKDEEVASDMESDVEEDPRKAAEIADEDSDSEEETVAEKRLRVTKQLIAEVEAEERARYDDEHLDDDAISHRLQKDLQERQGHLRRPLADKIQSVDLDKMVSGRGHKLPVTAIAVTSDNRFVFTASKDCSIIKWDRVTGAKIVEFDGGLKNEENFPGHTDNVLALAVSSDGRFLASGGDDKIVIVWDLQGHKLLRKFKGHRGSVTGLTFRRNTRQLFSCSADRTVKIWNIDELAYIETLYGHQDGVTSVASLDRERVISGGGRDQTVRLWKVLEESQLVFQGKGGSVDCVAMISEQNFVSGSEDGCLAVWDVLKKKPCCVVKDAHGAGNWISSVAAFPYSDVVASGSCDGVIRLWGCKDRFRTLKPLITIPMIGFVNAMWFCEEGRTLVAGVGQEHRLGRWFREKKAKNGFRVIPLVMSTKGVDESKEKEDPINKGEQNGGLLNGLSHDSNSEDDADNGNDDKNEGENVGNDDTHDDDSSSDFQEVASDGKDE